MTCDDFQIAIERELHGALTEPGRAQLARHLTLCSACREYRAMASEAERTMSTTASQVLQQVDWGRIEKDTQRRLLDTLQAVVGAVLGGAFMAALIWFTATPSFRAEKMLGVGAVLAGSVVLLALIMAYGAWALVRIPRGDDLIAQLRLGSRLQVAFARGLPWVDAVLACLFGWRAITGDSSHVRDPVLYGVLAAFMICLGLHTRLVRLPRALREQAEFELDRKDSL